MMWPAIERKLKFSQFKYLKKFGHKLKFKMCLKFELKFFFFLI